MKVRDLMVQQVETLAPDATVAEAAARLRGGAGAGAGNMPSLLVMESGKVLGIVTLSDILRTAIPPYMLQDPHLAHLGWDGLLEEGSRLAQSRPVRDVMSTDVVAIGADAYLTEAAELLLTRRIHSIPVTRDGTVVGILYLSDLARAAFARLEDPSR
jgi:CBS domain-containing protein